MALVNVAALQFTTSALFGTRSATSNLQVLQTKRNYFSVKPVVMRARQHARTESAKTLNRRMQKKYNGTPKKPRLSVFCSDKQLYAMLVDDQNKKCLFYGSTLQKSIRQDPHCSTAEAAKRVGEELIKACNDLNIGEISSYDRNGFATGERIHAFEIAISEYGFLSR
ncbi:putative ribosomal protein L18 [Rosa chinensis]|uniref:Putative ribosomal protein L18 n=1 Tax=Rosa chinensis TaxID=74649 RepID=A0A2P6PVE1_ROSCH|nr:50S ribosomal protein L18 [Rosa chinensis]PRQ25895.1 putative ribosomal protein L18 [Rosa chinensis]